MLVCTIPLAPFLKGRGKIRKRKLWRAHPPFPPASGVAPSGLPAYKRWGSSPRAPAKGLHPLHSCFGGVPQQVLGTIPLALPEGRGNKYKLWGHPQTPAKGCALWTSAKYVPEDASIPPARGVAPLWTPRWHALGEQPQAPAKGPRPLHPTLEGASMGARTIPLAPFLKGRGNKYKRWGTPPDPRQRAAPSALLLNTCRRTLPFLLPGGLHPSGLPAGTRWGSSPRPLPKGRARCILL